jgi:hypothetical protein
MIRNLGKLPNFGSGGVIDGFVKSSLCFFLVSTLQHEVIREMGRWYNNVWSWNLIWRRNLFQWEVDLVAQLESYIRGSPILLMESCTIGEDGH